MLTFILFATFFGLTLAASVPQTHLIFPTFDGRIVKGKDTTIEEHPYQVSLEWSGWSGGHWCGGSLIRSDVIVTAAHCTDGKQANNFTTRAATRIKNVGGELADVVRICQHPDYSKISLDYDVSVLQLNKSLPLGSSIQTITLQPLGTEIKDGTEAHVTGWGDLVSGGPAPSILQEVLLPKVSEESCKSSYPDLITSRMHCFGYDEGGKASCQGDSGGPVVVDGVQAGIVSWAKGCALPNYPSVFTKISDESITNHINECIVKFNNN